MIAMEEEKGNFNIEVAQELIKQHYLKRIEYFKGVKVPEEYEPKHWVDSEEMVVQDLARLIQHAIRDFTDRGIDYKAYKSIAAYTCRFYEYCVSEKSIWIEEIEKINPLFHKLRMDCMYEITDIGDDYCDTSIRSIFLMTGMILNKNEVIKLYQSTNRYDEDLIRLSNFINVKETNDYLLRRLYSQDRESWELGALIYALGNNSVPETIDFLDALIDHKDVIKRIPKFVVNACQQIQGDKSMALLTKLKDRSMIEEKNLPLYTVVDCYLKDGEQGLLSLFHETGDYHVRQAIITCYKHFRSKRFAELLINSLQDSTVLSNGFFPVRNAAHNEIMWSIPYMTLMQWFGYDVLRKITETTLKL